MKAPPMAAALARNSDKRLVHLTIVNAVRYRRAIGRRKLAASRDTKRTGTQYTSGAREPDAKR